jgi:fatty-acyl-CoA synthase
LWPCYATPSDLKAIEEVPLADRGLPLSTYAVLARAAALWPDRPAVTVLPDGQRWQEPTRRTFAELLQDVHRVANLLRALGIERHSAVALISPNCDELITATLAAQLAGIAAPINGALSIEHIGELIGRSGARVLIASGPELDPTGLAVARYLTGAGIVDTVLLLRPTGAVADGEAAPDLPGASVDYMSRLLDGFDEKRFAGESPAATDLAALFHTGGTTGTPKLAAHTHANEVSDAWMIAASMFDEESVLFAGLPLFHVNALLVTTLAPLLRGGAVVWAGPLGYRDTAMYRNLWKIVERYGISTMSAVPTVYNVLAQTPVDADISTMRMAVVGASPLPEAVRKEFESHTGILLVEGYGLTEATCASALGFRGHPRPGSVGQRLPYQHVKTARIDDDGTWHDLPRGTVGTLLISGPAVFPGYVTGYDADGYVLDGKEKLADGWLDTGDLARIDDDDFIYLTGRAKDLIIRGGHNIDPAIIEEALLAHPDVTGAYAVGKPDVHAGEVPVAFVTLRIGAAQTGEELRMWAGDHVAEPAAAPKAVTVVDSLPLTAVGKPYKVALRAAAARTAILEALCDVPGIETVDVITEDGAMVVTVTIDETADPHVVDRVLGRYPLTYRIVPQSDPSAAADTA